MGPGGQGRAAKPRTFRVFKTERGRHPGPSVEAPVRYQVSVPGRLAQGRGGGSSRTGTASPTASSRSSRDPTAAAALLMRGRRTRCAPSHPCSPSRGSSRRATTRGTWGRASVPCESAPRSRVTAQPPPPWTLHHAHRRTRTRQGRVMARATRHAAPHCRSPRSQMVMFLDVAAQSQ